MNECTTVVLFRDEEGNADFGLWLPAHQEIICLCCGGVLDPEEVEILHDFNGVECLEQAVASGGFYDELPDELKPLYTGAK